MTTHLITWILFAVLLAWMILFTILALRGDTSKKFELDEAPIHATSSPLTSAPSTPHVTVAQPSPVGTPTG